MVDYMGKGGIVSLGVSTVSTTFQGRSVDRGVTLASWEAVLSSGGSRWESALLALSSWERVILGWTALASLGSSPVLEKEGDCLGSGPSGLGSFPRYISLLFV